MKQQILKMIEAQSEDGHRAVSVFLAFYGLFGGQDLACHTGPDEGGGHTSEQGRNALSLRQAGVFQMEASGFES